ncbi:MAG TPA: ABC transporter permease [Micromonosporaceae bacterium]|nr:ABC transporter permease [Micromonosporaceae bacterium]
MTVTANRSSVYPPAVEALLPQARALADQLGALPSRNRLKAELRVGAPKAAAVLDALAAAKPTPQEPTVPELEPTPAPEPPAAPTGPHDPGPVEPDPAPPLPAVESVTEPTPAAASDTPQVSALPVVVVDPVPTITTGPTPAAVSVRAPRTWPLLLLALPAFVAIWSGWVGLGGLTGFGNVHPLPGIWDSVTLNTAITLPIGMETYAAYATRVWLTPALPARVRRYARTSAIGSLVLGAGGQVAYHLMTAAGMTHAPWQITTLVACIPVAVLGMAAHLVHLIRATPPTP